MNTVSVQFWVAVSALTRRGMNDASSSVDRAIWSRKPVSFGHLYQRLVLVEQFAAAAKLSGILFLPGGSSSPMPLFAYSWLCLGRTSWDCATWLFVESTVINDGDSGSSAVNAQSVTARAAPIAIASMFLPY